MRHLRKDDLSNMSKFWSDVVRGLDPYVPGEQANDASIIKLNTNENPYAPSPKVIESIRDSLGDQLRLYPDPQALVLRETIADKEGVRASNVFIGNGSDEVLAHAFRALFKVGETVFFPDITYSFYPTYCKLFDLNYEQVAVTTDFEIDLELYPSRSGGIIFPNPNAPTGIQKDRPALERFLQSRPDTIVVIDEAYVEFGAQTSSSLTTVFPNLLVTRSFSKSYSLAGLRIGYAIGHEDLIEGLYRVKDSFNSYPVDRLALVGAEAAIRDQSYLARIVEKIVSTRSWVSNELAMLDFHVLPSSANFLFVRHSSAEAENIVKKLRQQNILVRHFPNPDRIRGFLRISIGTADDMKILVDRLQTILAE